MDSLFFFNEKQHCKSHLPFVILIYKHNNTFHNMNFEIRKAEDFNTINWAGGTSTQLYIYPSTSDYQQRDFDFRLSTASVETEESDFTSLPGVSREIMILDGAINLIHKNRYSKQLGKFDTGTFEGDWNTSSVGKCIDFNLMTRGNTRGKFSALSPKRNQRVNLPFDKEINFLILYAFSGEIILNGNGEIHHLHQGNLMVITPLNSLSLQLSAVSNSEVIMSEIRLK